MKKLLFLFLTLTVNCSLITDHSIWASSPNTISYQGRLRESGQPVSGTRNIQFKLFDASSAGAEVFNSGSQSIYVSSGIFGYQLGGQNFKDLSWATSSYWLEISVGGNAMSPRERINAMPYAFMSSTASSLNGSGNIQITGAGNHYLLNGNVGIGTTAPGYKLDVYGLVSSSGIKVSKQNGGLVYDDGYGRIEFAMKSWSGSHAILFGANTPETWIDGWIQAEGNTKYAYDPGMYSRGAAGIFYYNHGGTFNISIATASTGAGNNITTWTSVFNARRDGTVYFNNGANVGIGTTNPAQPLSVAGTIESTSGGIKLPDGSSIKNVCYAQLEANTHTFPDGWTAVSWAASSISKGITYSGSNITFSQSGIYRVTLMLRALGGDVWTAIRLYGDGATKGKSAGFGSGANADSAQPTVSIFLARITNTGVTYQLQVGRYTGTTYASANPLPIAGDTSYSIVATIEKIDE